MSGYGLPRPALGAHSSRICRQRVVLKMPQGQGWARRWAPASGVIFPAFTRSMTALVSLAADHAVAAHRRDLQDLVLGKKRPLPVDAQGEEGRVGLKTDLPGDLDDLVDQAADDDRDSRVGLLELLQDRPDRLLVGETAGDAVGLVQSGRVLVGIQACLVALSRLAGAEVDELLFLEERCSGSCGAWGRTPPG